MRAALAQRPLELVSFEIDGGRYALLASAVREVVRAVSIVPLPKAPAIVEGVIDVRGTIAPVLDIRTRFGLPSRPLSHTDHFVIAWSQGRIVALRVDRALDLLRLDPGQVDDTRSAVPGSEYIAGVARLQDGLLLIHDLETFLSQAEQARLDAALASHREEGEP